MYGGVVFVVFILERSTHRLTDQSTSLRCAAPANNQSPGTIPVQRSVRSPPMQHGKSQASPEWLLDAQKKERHALSVSLMRRPIFGFLTPRLGEVEIIAPTLVQPNFLYLIL